MAMINSAYILAFSVLFFLQSMYTDYSLKPNSINIFCLETWAAIIFAWSTFKIMCDTLTHSLSKMALLLAEIINVKK